MYDLINGRIQGNPDKKVALVETWHERGQWYLGYSYEPLYYWRWQNEQGSTNGITKETAYKVDNNGDKYVLNVMPFIGTLADLKKVQKKYNYGFIFIDDDTYPKEIIEHAKTTMKKELYLDQYPLEDNPYSKWPATLYSWGFE
jgi:hypothetical protein